LTEYADSLPSNINPLATDRDCGGAAERLDFRPRESACTMAATSYYGEMWPARPREGIVLKPPPLHLSRARSGEQRRAWLLPLLILLAALSFLLAGVDLLHRHFLSETARPYRAFGGWCLVLISTIQLRIAWAALRRRERIEPEKFGLRSCYWRWFVAGPVICYFGMLALGPERNGRYLFRAAVGLWFTVMLLPLVFPSIFAGRWCDWVRRRFPRAIGHALFSLGILCVSTELVLRAYAFLSGSRIEVAYLAQQLTLPPGSVFRGRQVNQLGYWGEEFQRQRRPGVLRVAVLGDETILSGTASTNFLACIERRLTGVEFYNFGVPRTGPREYAATLADKVLGFNPDLVLTCISVGDDVTDRLRLPDNFDWHALHVYHFGLRALAWEIPGPIDNPLLHPPDDRETYLHRAAQRLAVCRSPLDRRMQRRWQDTFAHLDELSEKCRSREVPLALVVAPCDAQLDSRLRKTLCRRLGFRADEVDVHLPQRRLAQFSRQRNIPLIDLLPHFQLSNEAVYCPNDNQWSEQGNRLAADVIRRWLERRFSVRLAQARKAL